MCSLVFGVGKAPQFPLLSSRKINAPSIKSEMPYSHTPNMFIYFVCVQIFHMNIDVPAGVGVLQHLTHNYLPNCFSNTPYMDSLACPPGFHTVYYTVNSRKVGGGLQA